MTERTPKRTSRQPADYNEAVEKHLAPGAVWLCINIAYTCSFLFNPFNIISVVRYLKASVWISQCLSYGAVILNLFYVMYHTVELPLTLNFIFTTQGESI